MPAMPILNAGKTLELLWKRVRERGDLPGFAKVVSAIRDEISGEDDHEFNMTKTVLSDPALTQKVLRLANSAMYAAFGQNINTVSKAVLVLGTESIGHLAVGSKLIDGLSRASANSLCARKQMDKAVLAGHIARQVTSFARSRDAEEAVVCSILHDLGRMMATFYLYDYWMLVNARCVEKNMDEAQAALDILGVRVDDLGCLIAQRWGLPASIVNSLTEMLPQNVGEPLTHADWLAAVSTMSARCAKVICEDTAASSLSDIVDSYADMLGMDASEMLAAVETAKQSAEEDALSVGLAMPPAAEKSATARPGIQVADTVQILTRGVADMRDVVHSATTCQLMTMALETAYQGLGLSRAIFFLHNRNKAKYFARMGFGDKVQEILPGLVFGEAYQPDVFHAALAHDKVIFVKDARDPAFISKLPRWWRDALPTAQSFIILPLTANRHPAGFIYGDWDESLCAGGVDSAELLLPLTELRALMVEVLAQRSQQNSSLII